MHNIINYISVRIVIGSTHEYWFVHKKHEQSQNGGQCINPVACKWQDSRHTGLWQPNNWSKNCLGAITVVLSATRLCINLFKLHLTMLPDHINHLI
jgi:hypothetical protein